MMEFTELCHTLTEVVIGSTVYCCGTVISTAGEREGCSVLLAAADCTQTAGYGG